MLISEPSQGRPSSAADELVHEGEAIPPSRRVFCNRTLNLRAIRAVGFDMDYTLVHYRTELWEARAFQWVKQRLGTRGWPVDELIFDPSSVAFGLILDLKLGNIVKANRFGYVKLANHGTRRLSYDAQRTVYARTLVDLTDDRWVFVNSLFGIAEACLYGQLVDLLDANRVPEVLDYRSLYHALHKDMDEIHVEGAMKSEIVSAPGTFVEPDPDLPLALMDLANAGKELVLITNSEWSFAHRMMSHAIDPYLPAGMTWRDLFTLVIVRARKPSFFIHSNPLFEVVSDDGELLKPADGSLGRGRVYLGGDARRVERQLGLSGDQILYVGDHIFTDVHATKNLLRWRTALVVRELELDLKALTEFRPKQEALSRLMAQKEMLEHAFSLKRLALQRSEKGYGPQSTESNEQLRKQIAMLRARLIRLDQRVTPLAQQAAQLVNSRWGLLMRAGNDKSYFARQVERHADIYMSRVSNLLLQTPFVYLRAPGGSLPHDDHATTDSTLD